jgi:hypothetical protein
MTTTEELNLIVRLRDEASGALGNLRQGLGGLATIAGGAVVGGAAAAAGAIAGIGAAAISAGNRAADLRTALGEINDVDLQDAADEAFFLADAYGVGIVEGARSAARITDEFGGTTEDAFNLLIEGQEMGLDRFGDLNDTLNEYSQDFAALGITGEQTLGLINEGLEAGFMNTDKVGDAFNEFGIRLRDPAVIDNIGEIDGATAELFNQFARGEITQREAFEQIANSIESIEDPLQRQEAGVLAFGTTFEDFGEDATFALGAALEGIEEIGAGIDSTQREYSSFGQLWAGVTSDAQAALIPLSDKLLEIANAALPHITQAIEWFGAQAPGWIDMAVAAFGRVQAVIGPVIAAFQSSGETANDLGSVWQNLQDTVSNVANAIGGVVQSVFGVVQAFLAEHGDDIRTTMQETWQQIGEIINLALELINATVVPLLTAIAQFIGNNQDEIVTLISNAWTTISTLVSIALDTIMTGLQVLIALLQGDFTGAWQAIEAFLARLLPNLGTLVMTAFDTIMTYIGLVANALGIDLQGAFTSVQNGWNTFNSNVVQPAINGFNLIRDAITGALTWLNNLGQRFQEIRPPEWLTDFGGNVQAGWNAATGGDGKGGKGFAAGTMSAPPGFAWVGESGPELLNFRGGEQVFPNDVSMAMTAGGGGVSIGDINVSVSGMSRGEIVQMAVDEVARQLNAALDLAEMGGAA